ncbi:MAG: V-type ATP synthase subunit D [Gemmatimonadaceae bacterium]
MSAPRLAPTRVNLLRARRQLQQVERGTALLKRKREALVRELFRLARPAADVRARIGADAQEAYRLLLGALAVHGHAGLRAIAWPARELVVQIEPAQVWGISVSDITSHSPIRRMLDARGLAPATTGPTTSETASRFEALTELLLDAAAAEQRIRRVGDAVAQETRHLRTLEQRVAPQLEEQISRVQRTLQEREREEYLRLKHLQRTRASGVD